MIDCLLTFITLYLVLCFLQFFWNANDVFGDCREVETRITLYRVHKENGLHRNLALYTSCEQSCVQRITTYVNTKGSSTNYSLVIQRYSTSSITPE